MVIWRKSVPTSTKDFRNRECMVITKKERKEREASVITIERTRVKEADVIKEMICIKDKY